jgi:hypothetical protein
MEYVFAREKLDLRINAEDVGPHFPYSGILASWDLASNLATHGIKTCGNGYTAASLKRILQKRKVDINRAMTGAVESKTVVV